MTTTKHFDYLNRLLSISSSPSASGQLPLAFSYQYNDANQRTRVSPNDGSFWIYQYDALGQVTGGKKYFDDNTPVPGQQFEYGFDDIGNRTSAKVGGDQSGTSLRSASYGANSLNQYTNRTVPNGFDVLGIANAASSVTVNGSSADYRRGEYFQELLSVNNSSTSVWQSVTMTTSGGGTNTGNVFVPTATETCGHDADGNMTNDGRWTFTWDAENRLVSMEALSSVPSGAKKKLDFAYDYRGRRIQKIVSTWNGSAYVAASTNKFLYDAWNLVAELNGTNGLIRSYVWGVDLSGSMRGAGGIGGLLAIKSASENPSFVAYDGNGNVTGLVDATTGTTSGQFEYGPFGETIRLTPNAGNQSPFRFSTKYTDDESDFVYYGFRYCNPGTGRWLSRDLIGENGGLNIYGFVLNRPSNYVDDLGMGPHGNPVSGPNGPVGPSSPYAPNPWVWTPSYKADMPFAFGRSVSSWWATVDEQAETGFFNAKAFAPEYDDTAWYDAFRPRSVAAAKAYFRSQIEKQRDRLCAAQSLRPVPDFTVGAQWQGPPGQSEAELGDIQQTKWETVLWINDYAFRIETDKVRSHKNAAGNIEYDGEILLVDKLGAEDIYIMRLGCRQRSANSLSLDRVVNTSLVAGRFTEPSIVANSG